MKILEEWLKQVVFCMCFLELLYQLVPGKTWQNYLKFAGGLVFMLVLLDPVLQLLSVADQMETVTGTWQIWESGRQLQEAQEELAEIQKKEIVQGYRRELERQIEELTSYYDGEATEVEVTLKDAGNGELEGVRIVLEQELERELELKAELAFCYGLSEEQIVILKEPY